MNKNKIGKLFIIIGAIALTFELIIEPIIIIGDCFGNSTIFELFSLIIPIGIIIIGIKLKHK